MDAYLLSGAQHGCLLIPEQQAVEIWRASNGPGAPEPLDPAVAFLADPLRPGL